MCWWRSHFSHSVIWDAKMLLQSECFDTIITEGMWRGSVQKSNPIFNCIFYSHVVLKKYHPFSLSYISSFNADLALSFSLFLLNYRPGSCINTSLFPHHLPLSPSYFFFFWQIKVLLLFDKPHSIASSSEGERKLVTEWQREDKADICRYKSSPRLCSLWSAEHLSAAPRATAVHGVSRAIICQSVVVH